MLKKIFFVFIMLQVLMGAAHATENLVPAHHHRLYHHHVASINHFNDSRPSRWCGWQMRQWFGGDATYNLAANWAHRGVSTSAHIGAVVVWPHHVGYIVGFDYSRHLWVVRSGNSGRMHTVTEHPRSLEGTIAIREL
jgi:hypothetical protein